MSGFFIEYKALSNLNVIYPNAGHCCDVINYTRYNEKIQ
jgi:hypothetical protein